ncbi:class I lanthipeptide [Flagellimonas olearia]|uniref:Uncharacterized protein n=1 Tax=Flagellimonas olearia TaxID=552546 RepID=A0A444VQN8_9FLAO|nr:class I lanthipeptide [Allomuricauda olearia]RYC53127.1 hypothetical protein DN53_02600 [Allomuricauda olearia]
MKKAKISGKLFLKKQTISNLNANSVVGGNSNYCETASLGCPTDTTNGDCTSGTSIVISCC